MSAKSPPPGFVDLTTAQSAPKRSAVNVIGVVVDVMTARQVGKGDWTIQFKLQDPGLRNAFYGGEGLKVRYFKKRYEDLPPIKGIGDIVLLRAANVSEFSNETLLMGGFSTNHLVFSGASIPSPAFKFDYVSGNGKLVCHGTDGLRSSLGPVEQDHIITLKEEMRIDVKAVAPPVVAPPANAPAGLGTQGASLAAGYSRKFKLVKDIQHRVFSDICVEVVKKFTTMSGNCELYVTDYTSNDQMFYYAAPEEKTDNVRDGDAFGYNGVPNRQWPGPYGFMVLKVNLSEPHASFANHQVAEGELIGLDNVKVKLMPNNNRLEGDMWPDQNNPSKVQVKKLLRSRKEVSDLLLRKSEYWTARLAAVEKATKTETEALEKLTKGQKKRIKRQKDKEAARLKAEQEAAVAEKKIQPNPHVRCIYKDQPLTTISLVLDAANTRHTNSLSNSSTTYTLPFINARYHIKSRVVDFYPPNLSDFAIQLRQSELNDADDKSEYSADMSWENSTPPWEWSFALQVEEVTPKSSTSTTPPSKMWLNVSHHQAQHLFGNAVDDPTDLREDRALLNQLREKLYILWGDLEERKRSEERGLKDGEGPAAKRAKLDPTVSDKDKDAGKDALPSNLPFNCCLEEYGCLREGGNPDEIGDWEKQFMMFGVTIN